MKDKKLYYITISKKSRILILITIFVSICAITLSSITPIIIKTVVDLQGKKTDYIFYYIILLALTFFLSNIFFELRWWAYSNADQNNFLDHLKKILNFKSNTSAIRAHTSALGNRTLISTTLFTFTPIIGEVILGSILVFTIMPIKYSFIYLAAALTQIFLGIIFTYKLNPLFSNTRESEVSYFDSLNKDKRDILDIETKINFWYQGLKKINMMRSIIKATTLFWPSLALLLINYYCINDYNLNHITLGDILAINTYILQSSVRVEMVSTTLRDAVIARNDIFAAFDENRNK